MKEGWKKSVGKKAQVAIFIILGVLIVAAVAAYLTATVSLDDKNGNIAVSGEVRPIYNYVQDCIKLTGEDAIYQIGKTGGYVVTPEPRMIFDEDSDEGVAFYLYDAGKTFNEGSEIALMPSAPSAALADDVVSDKENLMPSKEVIERELSLYMDNFLYFCVSDFSDFSDFNISEGRVKTVTKIENGKVIFNVKYPLSISRENKAYTLNEFYGEVPVRLDETYSLISELMNEQMLKKDAICMSCIYDLSNKYEMKVKMMDAEEGIVFVVLDEKSKIVDKDYSFYFANKYD